MIFRALRSALQVHGFIYMSGAEEQGIKKLENYKPKSFDEIRTYFSGCLEMVLGEISNHGECRDMALDILEKVTPNLCRAGYADIVLPVVYKVAELLGWNWDGMQGSLLMFKESALNRLADTDKNLYMELLERLTKHDIVSEFRAVQKEGYASSHGKDFHEREKENQRKYAELAGAFASAYSKIDLEGLMVSENLLIHPFGSRMYELMNDDEKKTFVVDSVTILNGNPQAKTAILLDFFGAGKEAYVDVYAPSLQKLDNKDILFEIYGRLNVRTGSPYFGELTDMIKCGKAPVTAFNRYWINLPLATQTLDQKTAFFKVLLSFPGGLPVVMRMAAFMTMDKTIKPANNLINLLVSAIEHYHSDTTPVLQVDGVPMIATNILSNYKLDAFAAFIHHELIVYLGKTDNVIVNNYDISQLYEVLINKYFGIIWPELSASIVTDDILLFLHISGVVGTMMSNDEPGLLFKEDHLPEFMKLCEDYPAVAPARIIHMAPPYGPEGLSDLVMAILDNYGDQDGVLDELGAKLGSFSSSGSVIPNLEQQKDALVPLQYSENDKVASWAKRELLSLGIQIKKWRTIEEEPLM